MKRFAGKVAVVTGSSQGIGLAIARRLGIDGAKVVISSRKEKNVQDAVSFLEKDGISAMGTVCHVGKAADRKRLIDLAVEKYGRLDILVNNAGINPHFGSLLDVDEKTWDKLFDVNIKAGFMLCKEAVPHMENIGHGSIVFVSSITGYVPFMGINAYGVTKTALLGLTKALATTLADKKIRVNCIAPGVIKTDFSKALWDSPDDAQESMIKSMIPMGRLGYAEDCAGTVAFLCSCDAAYITGETIMITGGINARL